MTITRTGLAVRFNTVALGPDISRSLPLLEAQSHDAQLPGLTRPLYVKELPRVDVGMPDLACTRGHEFWHLNKVPAVAIISMRAAPHVIFSRFSAYHLCRHEDYHQN